MFIKPVFKNLQACWFHNLDKSPVSFLYILQLRIEVAVTLLYSVISLDVESADVSCSPLKHMENSQCPGPS